MHIYDISEVRVMHNIEEEIFSYMPKDLKIPDNVLEKAEEIRIRLRTTCFD